MSWPVPIENHDAECRQSLATRGAIRIGARPVSYTHLDVYKRQAYNSVLNERRRMLHGRIGPVLESIYAESLDDHVAELVHHYARSGNPRKAVSYCLRAVHQCGVRGSRAEAVAQFETGLEQLQKLPDDDQRAELELDLRNTAFAALFQIEGYASIEMERSYERALVLCRRPGIDSKKRWAALTGFYQVLITRCLLYTSDQSRRADAGSRANRLGGGDRCDPQDVRGIFRLQVARPDQGQRRERAGQGV